MHRKKSKFTAQVWVPVAQYFPGRFQTDLIAIVVEIPFDSGRVADGCAVNKIKVGAILADPRILILDEATSSVDITQHARKEAKDDNLMLNEIFFSTLNGEIIEDNPTDKPYPSCLISGGTQESKPVHSVWAYATDSQIGILITVYRPDPERWIDWKIRKQ